MADPAPHDVPPESVIVRSSRWGLVLAGLGAVLFVYMAIAYVAATGWHPLSITALIASLAMVAVAAFDMPIASEFTADGVSRRCLARTEHLMWPKVDHLERARVGVLWTRRNGRGPLVAKIDWRRYLLVDRTETPEQFDQIRVMLGTLADAIGLSPNQRPGARRRIRS